MAEYLYGVGEEPKPTAVTLDLSGLIQVLI